MAGYRFGLGHHSGFTLSRLTLLIFFNTEFYFWIFSLTPVLLCWKRAQLLSLLDCASLIPPALHDVAVSFLGKLIYLDLQFPLLEGDKRLFELKTKAQIAI